MPSRPSLGARSSLLVAVVSLALVAAVNVPADDNSIFASAGENLDGYETPEAAALDMFRACTRRSPKLFIEARMLGVCDGPVSTLNKYAECLHTTKYRDGENAYSVYDLPNVMKKETELVVASGAFTEEHIKNLRSQFLSTYYCETLIKCVEVEAANYDGRTYRTLIVVAKLSDRWYAMPRCRSSKSFYEIADAMQLTALK